MLFRSQPILVDLAKACKDIMKSSDQSLLPGLLQKTIGKVPVTRVVLACMDSNGDSPSLLSSLVESRAMDLGWRALHLAAQLKDLLLKLSIGVPPNPVPNSSSCHLHVPKF